KVRVGAIRSSLDTQVDAYVGLVIGDGLSTEQFVDPRRELLACRAIGLGSIRMKLCHCVDIAWHFECSGRVEVAGARQEEERWDQSYKERYAPRSFAHLGALARSHFVRGSRA